MLLLQSEAAIAHGVRRAAGQLGGDGLPLRAIVAVEGEDGDVLRVRPRHSLLPLVVVVVLLLARDRAEGQQTVGWRTHDGRLVLVLDAVRRGRLWGRRRGQIILDVRERVVLERQHRLRRIAKEAARRTETLQLRREGRQLHVAERVGREVN